MGVPLGESDGDHPLRLHCTSCDTDYLTDETVMNDCPHCGALSWEVVEE